MSTIDFQAELTAAGANVSTRWGAVRFFIRRYPLGAAGAVIMVLFLFAAAFAPYITVYDPLSTNAADSLAKPGMAALARLPISWAATSIAASSTARASRSPVALGAMALGSGIGVIVGLLSGLSARLVRPGDAARPRDDAVAAAAGAWRSSWPRRSGPSLHNTILAIAIPLVPYVARVIRSNTLSLREQPFVEAAKAIGMSETRIAIRHVLPNTMAPLIVLATAQLGSTILIEASLSFLGLGVPEPHPSWGRMLSESAAEYVRTAPWLVIFPGVAISFVVFGTNLLGDALRDLLDPRQRS